LQKKLSPGISEQSNVNNKKENVVNNDRQLTD